MYIRSICWFLSYKPDEYGSGHPSHAAEHFDDTLLLGLESGTDDAGEQSVDFDVQGGEGQTPQTDN